MCIDLFISIPAFCQYADAPSMYGYMIYIYICIVKKNRLFHMPTYILQISRHPGIHITRSAKASQDQTPFRGHIKERVILQIKALEVPRVSPGHS